MALDNLISLTLTDEEVQAINGAVTALNNILKEKMVNLTPEERRQFGSIADRNKVLVDKCKYYMDENPNTIPSVLDKEEFERDYKARKQLEVPLINLTSVIEMLKDTKTLLDHDNYHAAITYYRYMKFLSSQNEPGTSSIFADLKKHYKHGATTPPYAEKTEKTENK